MVKNQILEKFELDIPDETGVNIKKIDTNESIAKGKYVND
jgi:hypothetical protein